MKSVLRQLEWMWRHAVVYPFLKLVLNNAPVNGFVDLSSARSLLMLRYDKLGDMIVTKPIFRILKKRYPKLKLGVLTSRQNAEILQNDLNVDRKHVLTSNPVELVRLLRNARKESYDIVVNLIFNRTTSGALLANAISPRGIKIGQGESKYAFYFNKMILLQRSNSHMVEVLANYLKQAFNLNIGEEELALSYEIDNQSESEVNSFLKSHGLTRRGWTNNATRYVVLNISAGEPNNKFSCSQVADLARHFCVQKETNIVLICAPPDEQMAREVETTINSVHCFRFPPKGKASLSQIASLIQGSLFVITPDTAIVHLASAVQTPTFAVFSPLLKSREWFPYRVVSGILTADEGKPVSSIPSSRLIEEVESFHSELRITTN